MQKLLDFYKKTTAILKSTFLNKKEESEMKSQFADAIVMNSQGQILLLLRGNDTSFEPGKWGLPGGHIDQGESPEQAVKRELLEETNLNALECIEVHTKSIDSGGKIHYFQCEVDGDPLIILENSEHYNYMWANKDQWNDLELIADLKDTLNSLLPEADVIEAVFNDNPFAPSFLIVKKAFDEGSVSEEQFLVALQQYTNIKKSLEETERAYEIIKAAFDQSLISEDRYLEALEKAGKRGMKHGIHHNANPLQQYDYYITNAAHRINASGEGDFRKQLNLEIKRITNNKHDVSELTDKQVGRYRKFSLNANKQPFFHKSEEAIETPQEKQVVIKTKFGR